VEYCPDCLLAQISLRNGAGEHVLHCDGILKVFAIPRILAKLPMQLQATVNCSSLFFTFCDVLITNAKPCQNLCGMESSQIPLPGSWISASY
jgi:hypothetical protein